MRLGEHPQVASILANQLVGVELPDLTVITGPNGAGKTNLLTGLGPGVLIANDVIQVEQDKHNGAVRLFLTGQLALAAAGVASPADLRDRWAQAFAHLQNLIDNAKQQPQVTTDEQREQYIVNSAANSGVFTAETLQRLVEVSETNLLEMTLEKFRAVGPLMSGVLDPFAAHIGEIFVSWALRRQANDFAAFQSRELGRDASFLSQTDFDDRFGRPPWEVLTETLALIGLPYEFVAPSEDELAMHYAARLKHDDGTFVHTDALSSGEKVLVAIALSLFVGSWETDSVRLPKLLLLDEPDASLHPSMARSLLRVLNEIFVKQFGVKVILTTHSPTTVALAAEESLFIMRRSAPRLQKAASVDEALRELTVGVPTLSVRMENRRQIFVEAEDDQALYGRLFELVRPWLTSPRTAEFIAVGRKSNGGGVDAVLRIVEELRNRGVDTVVGLIDRDNRTASPSAHVYLLADRYSLESLIADPLLLGTFMLRENYVTPESVGLLPGTTHMQLGPEHMQPIVDAITSHVGLTADPRRVTYLNGETINVSGQYLDYNGHMLIDDGQLAFATCPALNAAVHRGLLNEIVRTAATDHPEYLPQSLAVLFDQVLS